MEKLVQSHVFKITKTYFKNDLIFFFFFSYSEEKIKQILFNEVLTTWRDRSMLYCHFSFWVFLFKKLSLGLAW